MAKRNLKVRTYDGMFDRRVATAAIVSNEFLSGLVPSFSEELVEGEFLQRVLRWCVDYYEEHQAAPGKAIQDIYATQYDALPPELADDLGDFLAGLSQEFENAGEGINASYLQKQMSERLQLTNLRLLSERIQIAVEDGDLNEAETLRTEFKQVTAATGRPINPLTDEQAIREGFQNQPKPLYELPGALGHFMNDQLTRDSFVSFLGREKIGKTWMLIEHAKRALRARRKVLFVQAGDLSQPQQTLRFSVSFAGRSNREKFCGEQLVPVLDCWKNQTGECSRTQRRGEIEIVEDGDRDEPVYMPFEEAEKHYNPCTYCRQRHPHEFEGISWWERAFIEPLTANEAIDLNTRFQRALGGELRLSCHPTGSVRVKDIEAICRRLEAEEGFVPQVILIDYADILAPETTRSKKREEENDRWMALRNLSQVRNALVIAPTQADADSYDRWMLSMRNFSEDKRKLGHVTAMYGLNQTPQEKKRCLMRVNAIVVREDDQNSTNFVTVLQSIKTGRPIITSF